MAPFSISTAIAAIPDEALRSNTRAILNKLNDTMFSLGYGYGVRDDSRLAFNWAVGSVPGVLVDLTEELCFIQWLSDNSNYHVVCEKALRIMANELKALYCELSWSEVWSIVRIYGPDMVR